MFIIIFSLLNISFQLNTQCNTILDKDCCVDTCEWQNEHCRKKQNNNFCNLNNFNEEQCRQHISCAFYDGKCEPFFGCQAYQNTGANCSKISINCISIKDELMCVQKPINCFQISDSKYCGQMDHQQGSKESCEWKDNKCQFIGCEKINELGNLSQTKCQEFHKICKFDGIECRIKLLECSQYTSNCNSIIAITGKCQLDTINQKCMNASCYNYFENSYEKCQNHFGQYGTQCIQNKQYFDGLCLEFDYKTQIGKCMVDMQDKSCNHFLSISKCFGINILKYDQKISFCVDENLERRECNTSLIDNECNRMETIELKQCQWIKDSCQTINQCSDYELRFDSPEKNCDSLNLGCKQITCSSNSNGCCNQIYGCSGYYNQQECTNNSDKVYDLLHVCIWESNACRYGRCEDFNNDSYQCNSLVECSYIGKVCLNRKNISCEGLEISDCIQQNCFYVNGKCLDVNEVVTKDISSLVEKLKENEDTICSLFSDKLMYCSETKNCRLKTLCENYTYYCQTMKQFDNVQCVNINSKCQPMTSCSQLQYKEVEKCFKASPFCNTNGKSCEDVQQFCNKYTNVGSCNFQQDQSKCKWQNNSCHLMSCEHLVGWSNCDSKNLCMEPQVCRQNMCFYYYAGCITIKSKCSLYNKKENCYKSIASYCFWDEISCLDLMNCEILSITQCQSGYYYGACIFDKDFNLCRNRENSNQITTNDKCLQSNYKYDYYCTTEEDRDQIISQFNNS